MVAMSAQEEMVPSWHGSCKEECKLLSFNEVIEELNKFCLQVVHHQQ